MSLGKLVIFRSVKDHELHYNDKGARDISGFIQLKDVDKALTIVDLSANQLVNIPEPFFQGLLNLQTINLRANQLSSLPEGIFQGLTSLQEINLSYNQLAAVSEQLFQGLSQLQSLCVPASIFCVHSLT
eukprot:TRINITY_DN6633_c0_g1_i4.p1 TRINITY_DN6633_c0_g1~~TRINITY_DN6633_c0_g1_i4.p1  ORF type:complete len:129 (-),score=14.53 TRINITY_DN6633_c0_g1_i4:173-559(-)